MASAAGTRADVLRGRGSGSAEPDPGPSADALDIPERPRRAPDVRLLDRMQETGFAETQWLVERDATFLQVTELLYRVLEACDGIASIDEVARRVTETTPWQVEREAVEYLLRTKLLPLGLVVGANEGVIRPAEMPRSVLQVAGRVRAAGPRFVEPIADALRPLHHPLAVAVAVPAIIAAHVWLYVGHGIGASIRQALLEPAAFLLVVAVLVVSYIAHEFGHASALRYGGGRVRGMGVGLYVVWLVFYTDVTDSYRLSRRARLRTDLGGFYFHLLFALAVMAVHLVTGMEALLLVVVLINLDIVRQLVPFLRLDGYWALADLTGIPDLFSQMGPFLRSLLPGRRWKGDRLPPLKPWVRRVFAVYIAVTVPLLVGILTFIAFQAPAIIAAVRESAELHAGAIATARAEGDVVALLASVLSLCLVVVVPIGLTYVAFKLITTAVRASRGRRRGIPAARRAPLADYGSEPPSLSEAIDHHLELTRRRRSAVATHEEPPVAVG